MFYREIGNLLMMTFRGKRYGPKMGATTFSIMTLIKRTLSIMTLRMTLTIMTLSMMTLSIMTLSITLNEF